MKLNRITVNLMALGVFVILISGGCGGQPEAILDKVLSVSDSPHTMGGNQAVIINFGGNNDNGVLITIHRSSIYKGFSVNSQRRNSNKISTYCIWGGKMYTQSSKHDTELLSNVVYDIRRRSDFFLFHRQI
jgi:hypothetical protein